MIHGFNLGVSALLNERFPWLKTEENVSLARRTTIGCGGTVAVSASPSDAEEASELLAYLLGSGIPYAFLGAGANTLPQDEDIDGVLIRTDRLTALLMGGNCIFAGAGVTGGALCRFARGHGVGGFEPFTGIPMTVGGAVTMNAGVPGWHISDVVIRVLAVQNGKIRSFPLEMCAFGEKKSVFQEGIFVVGALFRAEPASKERIAANTARYRERRKSLPKGRSMGCTFVNPEGRSAGELIESCGLKGFREGGAHVSEVHANFIINEGGTAADVAALIGRVRGEVLAKTGISLREEIRRLTFDVHT